MLSSQVVVVIMPALRLNWYELGQCVSPLLLVLYTWSILFQIYLQKCSTIVGLCCTHVCTYNLCDGDSADFCVCWFWGMRSPNLWEMNHGQKMIEIPVSPTRQNNDYLFWLSNSDKLYVDNISFFAWTVFDYCLHFNIMLRWYSLSLSLSLSLIDWA